MMLLVASVVFLYYTIWTLFIVCSSPSPPPPTTTTLTAYVTAIRRRRPSAPRSFSSARLGDSYPGDSHPRGHRGGRQLLERRHDQERAEEGGEGEGEGGGTREEEELGATAPLLVGGETEGKVYCICFGPGSADIPVEGIEEDLIRAYLIAHFMIRGSLNIS